MKNFDIVRSLKQIKQMDADIKTVYIVDDSADQIFLLKHFFKRYLPGYAAEFFDSGKSLLLHLSAPAEEPAHRPAPALIILDFYMPAMSGDQILHILKNPDGPDNYWWKKIPVVINSSLPGEQIIRSCYEAGALAFLVKSGDFKEITGLLKSNWFNEVVVS